MHSVPLGDSGEAAGGDPPPARAAVPPRLDPVPARLDPAPPRLDPVPAQLDPVSAGWVADLTSEGAEYQQACTRLHADLLRIAFKELARRQARHRLQGRELDDMAHQVAADALLAITRKVERFRGESRFTTWAYKFVILEVSSSLGRLYRRTQEVPMEAEEWERLPDRFGFDPAEQSGARDMAAALRTAVDEVLTAHQRRIFVALVLHGVPVDALAAELDTTRNALYKTMFDARRKLRLHMEEHGYLEADARRRP
ncbi:sigma-70 family RNA polymerase sigma factor [Streptomyces sp. TS71-3]|uniref:sigma-70 family RNA polymerase sigma factor n=1 Tax=Streptomyces sp. TS71-3 TaxID=2733862 RepID=UPI002017E997|nr:sigma-70 family RNA polymerase sigma factor [Streptomyces sp. TS71-3]